MAKNFDYIIYVKRLAICETTSNKIAEDVEICFVNKGDDKEVSAESDTGKRRWKKSSPSCFMLEL